jgi:hypothetical protein
VPILYQPAQPIAPELSSRYGAAVQSHADIPQILEAQRMQQQANAAAAANAQAANQHAAALAQQVAQFREGLQQTAYDRAADRDVEAQQFATRVQQAPILAEQHAALTAWVNQQEMTQADTMRLQKLQAALSEVMANDTLTPEEKSLYAMHLKTGIDPLQQRAKQTQMKHMEEQNRILMDQHKRNTQLQDLHDRYNAQTAQERLEVVQLPDGSNAFFMPDGKGGKVQIKQDTPKPEKPVPFDVAKAIKEAEIEADAAVPPTENDTGKLVRSAENAQYKFKVLQRMRAEHERAHPVGGKGVVAPAAAAPVAAEPPPAEGPPPAKPFDPKKLADATPPQRQVVTNLYQFKRLVALKPSLSTEDRLRLDGLAEDAAQMFAAAGSVDNMMPADQKRFTTILEQLRDATRQAAPAPAAAPAGRPDHNPYGGVPGF